MNRQAKVVDIPQPYVDLAPELFINTMFIVSRDRLRAYYRAIDALQDSDRVVYGTEQTSTSTLWSLCIRIAEKLGTGYYANWFGKVKTWDNMTTIIDAFAKYIIHPYFYEYEQVRFNQLLEVGDRLRYDGGDFIITDWGKDWGKANNMTVGKVYTITDPCNSAESGLQVNSYTNSGNSLFIERTFFSLQKRRLH